ncbi:MAG: 2-dehydro-3-deoxygalactonokinase [Paracoccaceae bacterium]
MGPHDSVLAEGGSSAGMGALTPDGFEPALLTLVLDWLGDKPVDVIVCGMAGAKQGWTEAPYRSVPCTPLDPTASVMPACTDPRLRVRILSGLSQARPADVMRGEETQIAGFLSDRPDFDGVLCLPGTHTKWAHISAGEVVSFRTFMTGEMFALLSAQSVLRHGLNGDGVDVAAFLEAVSDTMSRPETLAARLFGIRAEGLLAGLSPAAARGRLSGLLIGAELAAARPYWLGQPVAIIGSDAMSRAYLDALTAQGASAEIADAARLTLAGLAAAYRQLKGR